MYSRNLYIIEMVMYISLEKLI